MSCYFCGGSRIASLHSAPDRDIRNWSVGSMALTRRYDGQPIIALELDTACDERDVSLLRDVQQYRVGELDGDAAKRGRRHARGQLEQPVIRSATDLFRATAWRTVPDLVSGPARRALVHGRADAPRVTSAQIGETERRARTLERDRARALKRSRKAKR